MAKHGKTKDKKRQHYVPRCYLKAWHDPAVPPGGLITPYVWQFDRDGTNPRPKAPANIFTETDIYTIQGINGERDLRLEDGLSGVEDKFTRIRNLRFSRREWPDSEQLIWVKIFVATAHVRTPAMRDFHAAQWQGIREHMERMASAVNTMHSQDKERFANISNVMGGETSRAIGIEKIRQIEQNPIHQLL